MNPEKINIAIASHQGFIVVDLPINALALNPRSRNIRLTEAALNVWRRTWKYGMVPLGVPNYCGDLSLIAPIVRQLTDDEFSKFLAISETLGPKLKALDYLRSRFVPTALFLCEVYLRNLGQWVEKKVEVIC